MTIGAANTSAMTSSLKEVHPFEWLTSPESLGGLIQDHVLSTSINYNSNNDDRKQQQQQQHKKKVLREHGKALHIGCGSSTVGEYLVEQLGFEKVVNVDRDYETLERMQQRWINNSREELKFIDNKNDTAMTTKLKPPSSSSSLSLSSLRDSSDNNDKNNNNKQENNRMEFWCYDYTQEKLSNHYTQYFDLVVDKSTLDCTLCSDSTATTSFLIEVYKSLKKPNDENSGGGGVYLVISFHELDLLLPLLRDMPGAQWNVDHTTMERQIESIVQVSQVSLAGNDNDGNCDNNGTATIGKKIVIGGEKKEGNSSNIISKPVLDHGEKKIATITSPGIRKPLNVLIARRIIRHDDEYDESLSSSELDFDKVCQHVQDVNDRWFQEEQPLLTNDRIQDLKHAFSIAHSHDHDHDCNNKNEKNHLGGKRNDRNNDNNNETTNNRSKFLSLEEAYGVIFTAAEREHLTYDHFLEDWSAFQNDASSDTETNYISNLSAGMTCEMALHFLRANQ
mmetsp:Transcript_3352/g.3990  ORF Transcript_3352/g.3990 Transcript_3352/m.3990 type:complete len:506 (-) Transcript_3352:16-1533(-)